MSSVPGSTAAGPPAPGGRATGAQRAEKVVGPPVVVALWSVTQVVPPAAVFLPVNPGSRYRDGFHDFGCDPAEYLAGIESKGIA